MCVRGLFLYALYGFREVGAKHVGIVVEKGVDGAVAQSSWTVRGLVPCRRSSLAKEWRSLWWLTSPPSIPAIPTVIFSATTALSLRIGTMSSGISSPALTNSH